MIRLIPISLIAVVCLALIANTRADDVAPSPGNQTTPQLITQPSDERTGFQEAAPYASRSDLRTDFVMAYGVDPSLSERLARWREAGYVPLSWSGEFLCPIWVGRLADPTTRKGCKESLDQDTGTT